MKLTTIVFLMLFCMTGVAHARQTQVISFAAPADLSARHADAATSDVSPAATGMQAPWPLAADMPGAPSLANSTRLPTDGLAVPAWMQGRGQATSFARVPADSVIATPCGPVTYRPLPGLGRAVEGRRFAYFDVMATAACEAGVPLELYDAVILQESQYRPFAQSAKGAAGMAQLMPQTAKDLHVLNVWDAAENLRAGARYLRAQIDAFARYDLALGAYNAGPRRIRRYGGLPPFDETRTYVAQILGWTRLHLAMRSGDGSATPRRTIVAWVPRLTASVTSF